MLHCCKSAESFNQVDRTWPTTSNVDGVGCGISVAGGMVAATCGVRAKRAQEQMQKAKRAYQRNRTRNVRDDDEGSWAQAPQSVEEVQQHFSGTLDNYSPLTGQSKASSSKYAEALMCWQLLACIPERISRGRQYKALGRCVGRMHTGHEGTLAG